MRQIDFYRKKDRDGIASNVEKREMKVEIIERERKREIEREREREEKRGGGR